MSITHANAWTRRAAAIVMLAAATAGVAFAGPGQLRAGDYTIYYNALSGDNLPLESTRAYGLRHAADQGLVIITVNAGHADTGPNVPLTVAGHATTLLGYTVPIKVRYIHDRAASYSALVTFTVSSPETIRFELDVTPHGGPTTHLRFAHSFAP